MLAGYILIAFAYWGVRLLPHPGRSLVGTGTDTQIFVWSFAWWPHALGHGLNPFEASSIWAPQGVNLAWTATAPGMALLFTPLTLLTGPIVSFDVATILMPALTAWTAFLLCRYLTRSLWASLVGGYLFGFSGYMIGQIEGHLHMTTVFLLLQAQGEPGTAGRRLLRDPGHNRSAERAVADREHSRIRPHGATRVGDRPIDLDQSPPRALEQHGARRRQLHPPRRTHEQHEAKLALQITNRPRERRLRHMQPLRSPPKMQCLSDSHEIAQLPKLNRCLHKQILPAHDATPSTAPDTPCEDCAQHHHCGMNLQACALILDQSHRLYLGG